MWASETESYLIKVTDSVVMQNEILNPGLPHYKLVIQNVLSGRKEYPRFSEVSGWGWGWEGQGTEGSSLREQLLQWTKQLSMHHPSHLLPVRWIGFHLCSGPSLFPCLQPSSWTQCLTASLLIFSSSNAYTPQETKNCILYCSACRLPGMLSDKGRLWLHTGSFC